MSSHCHRYPACGCPPYPVGFGKYCHLSEEDFQQKMKDPTNEPYSSPELQAHKDQLYQEELLRKEKVLEKHERIQRGGSGKPHRKHASNYTPPKKRRK